ncbi:MAG TPA: 50S ribosomal protein L1 [Candidatus Saccharimonadales bacterium]|nr:50S ribosomal protein L1 [Candidatus Saccharimonadales bacterium]
MAKAPKNEEEIKTTADVPAEVEEQIVNAEAVEVAEEKVETSSAEGKLAKSGKRSAKAIAEAEEKVAKEERKAHTGEAEAESKPKAPVKPARSRLERRGKKFRDAAKQVEADKVYGLEEAVTLAAKTSTVKFDATVELHINLNVDPRHADQNIRDNLVLPAGTGKTVRVAVFADDKVEGADLSGVETITKALDKGELNFDVLVATPANMPKLGKYARTLGPRGLMPNPKSGTVTSDLTKAVQDAKAGRVEYRVDSTGIVHLGVGKVSFTPAQLTDNVRAVLASVRANKPSSVKSNYIRAVHLTTTMGPSITVSTAE